MIEWSQLPDKITDLPIQPKDGFVLSHTTDGGTTYTVSKFGTIDELATYITANLEFDGTNSVVPYFLDGGLEDSHLRFAESGMYIDNPKVFAVGSLPDGNIALKVKGDTNDNTKAAFIAFNSDNDYGLWVDNDLLVYLANGTGINEFSTDGTLAGDSDDAVPTEKAVKTYVDAQSGGGWLGSETRIKIAPWDVVSYNDKDGVSIQNNGGVVNDAAAKITTMVTGVFIPTGYRATAFMINASANIAVELFESQIDDDTQVSKGSGNANTEINITNVDSTTTNYLSIIIVEAGNDIYGGYITIEKI
jgi:hypothetical protein